MAAAAQALGADAGTVLQLFGQARACWLISVQFDTFPNLRENLTRLNNSYPQSFVSYLEVHKHDRLLSLLGGNLHDFIQNLDFLHGHLQAAYPTAVFPSFQCMPSLETGKTGLVCSRALPAGNLIIDMNDSDMN